MEFVITPEDVRHFRAQSDIYRYESYCSRCLVALALQRTLGEVYYVGPTFGATTPGFTWIFQYRDEASAGLINRRTKKVVYRLDDAAYLLVRDIDKIQDFNDPALDAIVGRKGSISFHDAYDYKTEKWDSESAQG